MHASFSGALSLLLTIKVRTYLKLGSRLRLAARFSEEMAKPTIMDSLVEKVRLHLRCRGVVFQVGATLLLGVRRRYPTACRCVLDHF